MVSLNGLTESEVKERIARGEVNAVSGQESHTYLDIIKENVFTGFNILLFIIGIALVLVDEPLNALAAVGVIVFNILIATVQECRAKRRLDKIALLLRPKITVIRDGVEKVIDQKEVVKDDLIKLSPGDQAVVDGTVIKQNYLEMDESLLTGESKTVRKKEDETIYSGSFCVAGDGYYVVDAFGTESYAAKLMTSAKKMVSKKTPLQIETQTIIEMLMIVALIFSLIFSVMFTITGKTLSDILVIIAVVIDIVPIALFLLIVITYMIAAIRIADVGVLLQRSNSVESLSHVDTICMDKTGTITTNKLCYEEQENLSDKDIDRAIKLFIGSSGGKNRTVEALENHFGSIKTEAIEEIRFTSERKFSAVKVNDDGKIRVLFMGAYSVLDPYIDGNHSEKIANYSERGLRSVCFAEADSSTDLLADDFKMPKMEPLALIAISDVVRPDCREIIDTFMEHGMDLKVISGDDPKTVDALFTIAKIPGERKIISGDDLAKLEGETKTKAILETNIFGRMKPDQKEEVMSTLRANGRYVAMVGDGVNDVKSLKKANVGIALETGSGAARGVADMVLVKDNFSALPKAFIEGKKTVSGMRDILKIYISRNFTLAMVVFITLMFAQNIPFNPVQNIFYALLSVSGSAFFMAIWAKPGDDKGLILPGVLKYALPTAVTMTIFAIAIFVYFMAFGDTGIADWSILTPEIIADLDQNVAFASAMMILFLTFSGILQLLVVQPRFKIFSIDGKTYKDIRPILLMVLLLAGAFAGYNVDIVLNMMEIPLIPIVYQVGILGLAFVWLVVQHAILKLRHMDIIDVAVQNWYQKSLEKQRQKEMARDNVE